MNISVGDKEITFDETIHNSIYIECSHEPMLKGFIQTGIKSVSQTHIDSKVHFISSSRMSMNKEFMAIGIDHNHFDSTTITHAIGSTLIDSPIKKILDRRKFILNNSGKGNESFKTWARMNESRRNQQLREIPYDILFLVDLSEILDFYRSELTELLTVSKDLGIVVIAYSKETLPETFQSNKFSKKIHANFSYTLEEKL